MFDGSLTAWPSRTSSGTGCPRRSGMLRRAPPVDRGRGLRGHRPSRNPDHLNSMRVRADRGPFAIMTSSSRLLTDLDARGFGQALALGVRHSQIVTVNWGHARAQGIDSNERASAVRPDDWDAVRRAATSGSVHLAWCDGACSGHPPRRHRVRAAQQKRHGLRRPVHAAVEAARGERTLTSAS